MLSGQNIQDVNISRLMESALFRDVPEDVLRSLEPPPEMIFLPAGEILIRQGEVDGDYYHLVSGNLRVFVMGEAGKRVAIAQIVPGEGVGEMSLLTGSPRSATVIARIDSELVRFPQTSFQRLTEQFPSVALNIARTVIQRLTGQIRTTAKPEPVYRTIAVVPLSETTGTSSFARNLKDELCSYGSARLLDKTFSTSAEAIGFYSADGQRLHRMERGFDYLVYEAEANTDTWSSYCFFRADLILLVVDAETAQLPDISRHPFFRKMDRDLLGRLDLVLLHRGSWLRQCGTARWLSLLSPNEHHHLRSGNAEDISRLARILTGRANNLVLGGGGARAFAQIGALRALLEFGVPIDRIGGSSMGSFIGAIYAYQADFQALVQTIKESFLDWHPARDLTFPLLSVYRGRRLEKVARDVCGNWRIEDMPLRYFCLSSDIASAAVVEHFEGSVATALRSGCAMPVLAPPLFVGKQVLVDGGVLNNLPIDIMKKHFSGSVLAIDVSIEEQILIDPLWEMTTPSGFQILCNRLNPFRSTRPIPSIVEILYRTLTLSCESQLRKTRHHADFLIMPSVERYGLMDFQAFDNIVEIGYQHAVKVLESACGDPDLAAKIGMPSRSGALANQYPGSAKKHQAGGR